MQAFTYKLIIHFLACARSCGYRLPEFLQMWELLFETRQSFLLKVWGISTVFYQVQCLEELDLPAFYRGKRQFCLWDSTHTFYKFIISIFQWIYLIYSQIYRLNYTAQGSGVILVSVTACSLEPKKICSGAGANITPDISLEFSVGNSLCSCSDPWPMALCRFILCRWHRYNPQCCRAAPVTTGDLAHLSVIAD